MKTLLARSFLFALLLSASALTAPVALAQEADEEGHGGIDFLGGPEWSSVQEVTVWSIAGVAIFAILLGVLYLFKRTVGGFPANPAWVAPISIMPASELPSDDDSPHEDHVGHDAHEPHDGPEAHGGHAGHATAH
jgi:hypothetical protein